MVSLPQTKMPFWKLQLGDSDFSYMKKYISAITVEYSLNAISRSTVEVTSPSFLESYFERGKTLKIWFGFNPLVLIPMFSGKIDKNPEGTADDMLRYSITALDSSGNWGKKEKVRDVTTVFPTKQNLIMIIAAENGYAPVVVINDVNPIKASEWSMQKGMTDLEFVAQCAKKWNCVFWIDSAIRTLYFYDADKAHKQGDVVKLPGNINDAAGPYKLGYKTTYGTPPINNVAKVSWKFGKPTTGNPGSKIAEKRNEKGKVLSKSDYIYEFFGKQYKFNPTIIEKGKKDPSVFAKLALESSSFPVDGSEISKYWVEVKGDSATNKDAQSPPSHKINQLVCDIDLNVGDPYLRPPRQARLFCGSDNPRAVSSDLPNWLVTPYTGTLFNLNKVKTQISDGMMKTSLEVTL